MRKDIEPLLTPWKIGKCEIKNRIVLTSMGGTDLFGWMEINHFDKAGAKFIMEVAKNNCGLLLPGCQPVYNPMFGQWLYKKKKMFEIHENWCIISLRLACFNLGLTKKRRKNEKNIKSIGSGGYCGYRMCSLRGVRSRQFL